MAEEFSFEVSVSTEKATGAILAVYFRFREGRSAEVVTLKESVAYADYDKKGRLLGVEILAPCQVSVLDRLVKEEPEEKRKRIANFIRESGPPVLLLAS